jgi:transposase, IS30 family
MAKKAYHHLTYEQRCQIEALKKSGMSDLKISIAIGVSKSSLSRELSRNSVNGRYDSKEAQKLSESRRQESARYRKKMTKECIDFIEDKLIKARWSPEQISGFMKRNMNNSVSHERIYQHIWEDKANGGNLYTYLRHHGKKYNKRSGKNAGRGCIPGRIDIDERPKIVDEKTRIGDCELDTIIGKDHQGAIVSMVDRASKFTKLILVPNKTAEVVKLAIIEALKPIKPFVLTMTADNGKEFAAHQELKEALGAQVYFAKPYHSWERGLNEHTNGLVRQYFPKKTRFDTISQEEVHNVEILLNSRPRKILNFQTPMEVFNRSIKDLSTVALQG